MMLSEIERMQNSLLDADGNPTNEEAYNMLCHLEHFIDIIIK